MILGSRGDVVKEVEREGMRGANLARGDHLPRLVETVFVRKLLGDDPVRSRRSWRVSSCATPTKEEREKRAPNLERRKPDTHQVMPLGLNSFSYSCINLLACAKSGATGFSLMTFLPALQARSMILG